MQITKTNCWQWCQSKVKCYDSNLDVFNVLETIRSFIKPLFVDEPFIETEVFGLVEHFKSYVGVYQPNHSHIVCHIWNYDEKFENLETKTQKHKLGNVIVILFGILA